jgi:hypothetical protein
LWFAQIAIGQATSKECGTDLTLHIRGDIRAWELFGLAFASNSAWVASTLPSFTWHRDWSEGGSDNTHAADRKQQWSWPVASSGLVWICFVL